MKTKKMSLANIQGKLSRAEMKKINGGTPSCGEMCSSDSDCRLNDSCPKCLSGAGPNGGCGCGRGAGNEEQEF